MSDIKIDLQREFPKTRAEALRVSELVRQQANAAGCLCRQIKVEFIEPRLGKPYVQVGHDVTCPLSRPA